MFNRPEILSAKKHGGYTFSEATDHSHLKNELLCPIASDEIALVSREYPIVFFDDKPLPYALLGLASGQNAYVGPTDEWLAQYLPRFFKNYPFALRAPREGSSRMQVLIESDERFFNTSSGSPLFDGHGSPMPVLKKKLSDLQLFAKYEAQASTLVSKLKSHEILRPQAIEVRGQVSAHSVSGFLVIDVKKLNALSGEQFLAVRSDGLLPLIFCQLQSMANLYYGPLGGKYPDLSRLPSMKEEVSSTGYREEETDFDIGIFADSDEDIELP